ncbi:MAG: endonuclease/exonuclease/phosphatase family protein [Acidimicrobiales bacterium]
MVSARRRAVVMVLVLLAASCSSSASDPESAPTTTTTTQVTTTTTTSPPTAPASTAPTTSTAPEAPDVRVATINLLHGLELPGSCAPGTDQCAAPARLDMLWDRIETEIGCPDVVALQEISPRQWELVPATLGDLCDGRYTLLGENLGAPDQEMILTDLEVIDDRFVPLSGPPWSAHWAQLESDIGVIDVFATHYASSAFNPDCDGTDLCAPECEVGVELGTCNAVETLTFLDANADPAGVQLVIGDLNKEIDDPRMQTLTDEGFVDVFALAGLPECDPETGEWCTSGIGSDSDLDGLDDPDQRFGSRIDFILVRTPRTSDELCNQVDTADDADGDGTPTGLWANTPSPEPVDGVVWPSDHAGVVVDLSCT